MSTNSNIEWTDTTWNPVAGCTIVSPGCTNCYAMKMASRLEAMGQAKYAGLTKKVNRLAVWTGKINCDEKALTIPLSWRKPRRVFVNSMSDLFHEDVPDKFVRMVFAVMSLCGQHTFQILTKRPERMAAFFADDENCLSACQAELCVAGFGAFGRMTDTSAMNGTHKARGDGNYWPLPNVWLGTSVEDQKRADERIPHLLRCPAAVRFLSCEPLLSPVDLTQITGGPDDGSGWTYRHWNALTGENWCDCQDFIRPIGTGPVSWVIVGGESGPGARACDVEWVRGIVGQCQAAEVPVFVKQLGAKPYQSPRHDNTTGYELLIEDSKGGEPDEWPSDLRVREFPGVTVPA